MFYRIQIKNCTDATNRKCWPGALICHKNHSVQRSQYYAYFEGATYKLSIKNNFLLYGHAYSNHLSASLLAVHEDFTLVCLFHYLMPVSTWFDLIYLLRPTTAWQLQSPIASVSHAFRLSVNCFSAEGDKSQSTNCQATSCTNRRWTLCSWSRSRCDTRERGWPEEMTKTYTVALGSHSAPVTLTADWSCEKGRAHNPNGQCFYLKAFVCLKNNSRFSVCHRRAVLLA